MISFDEKDIFDVKLAVTTDCFFDCEYCFVKKDRRTMTLETAKKALDLIMSRPPCDKIVRIYGGEPLMRFDLVEEIARYARKLEKKFCKELTLTLCTNGYLLKEKYLNVLKKHGFRYAVSIDGEKKFHDRHRGLRNKEKSVYETVKENILTALKNSGKENIAAGLGVAPDGVEHLFENFRYLLNLGFDTVNVEPIHGFLKWDEKKIAFFFDQMKAIADFITSEIRKKNFVFLTTIDRELKYKTLSELKKGRCLFYQSMEICPDGEIGFSSFLINSPEREKYLIGNIHTGIWKKLEDCQYERGNGKCQRCVSSYFGPPDAASADKVLDLRDLFSIKTARLIEKEAERDRKFADYIKSAKQHICF